MAHLALALVLGIFFVLPCIESYQKVDLRTITLGVPPQEVRTVGVQTINKTKTNTLLFVQRLHKCGFEIHVKLNSYECGFSG